MLRVAVLDDYQRRAAQFADWSSLGEDVEVVFFAEALKGDALAEALSAFNVVVCMRERSALTAEVLERIVALELVVTTGMMNASIDLEWLAAHGIPCCGTGVAPRSAGGIATTAELAWALIFALTKRVVVEDRALREGRWQLGYPSTLAGMTLGVIGLGRVGSGMVAPAKAFGMEVLAWSQNLTPERAAEHGATLATKEELLERSDVVSLHVVASSRTRDLIGAEELARMKPSSILINTARGRIVVEQALLEALRAGTIAGAGLDVYNEEPLPPGHPLTRLDNVVLLPHLGYVAEENMHFMYGQVVEDIAAWRAGSPIREVGGS